MAPPSMFHGHHFIEVRSTIVYEIPYISRLSCTSIAFTIAVLGLKITREGAVLGDTGREGGREGGRKGGRDEDDRSKGAGSEEGGR